MQRFREDAAAVLSEAAPTASAVSEQQGGVVVLPLVGLWFGGCFHALCCPRRFRSNRARRGWSPNEPLRELGDCGAPSGRDSPSARPVRLERRLCLRSVRRAVQPSFDNRPGRRNTKTSVGRTTFRISSTFAFLGPESVRGSAV